MNDFIIEKKEELSFWVYSINDDGKIPLGKFFTRQQAQSFIDDKEAVQKFTEELVEVQQKIDNGEVVESDTIPF